MPLLLLGLEQQLLSTWTKQVQGHLNLEQRHPLGFAKVLLRHCSEGAFNRGLSDLSEYVHSMLIIKPAIN
jgi:hypothetical protein